MRQNYKREQINQLLGQITDLRTKGLNNTEAAEKLNQMNLRTASGHSWTSSRISVFLNYYGKRVTRKSFIRRNELIGAAPQQKVLTSRADTALTTIQAIVTDPNLGEAKMIQVLQAYFA